MHKRVCMHKNHTNKEIIYLCLHQKCQQNKFLCLDCTKELHSNHMQDLCDYTYFIQKIEPKLQQIQLTINTIRNFKEKCEEYINYIMNQALEHQKIYSQILDEVRFSSMQNIPPYVASKKENLCILIDYFFQEFDNNFNILKQSLNSDLLIKQNDSDQQQQQFLRIVEKVRNLEYETALVSINKELRLNQLNFDLLNLKCHCLLALKQLDEAQKIAQFAYQLDPENEQALIMNAKILIEQNNTEEAQNYISEGFKQFQNSHLFYILQGEIYHRNKQYDLANKFYISQSIQIKNHPQIKQFFEKLQKEYNDQNNEQ